MVSNPSPITLFLTQNAIIRIILIAVCEPGSYSLTGYKPCTQCGIGTYQLFSGRAQCRVCPGRMPTRGVGSREFSECLIGKQNATYIINSMPPYHSTDYQLHLRVAKLAD